MNLGFDAVVPGNASRYLTTKEEALESPVGRVSLTWNERDKLVTNTAYDANLISYDRNYLTTVASISGARAIPTLHYFSSKVLPFLCEKPIVVDIGCGQGEFVEALLQMGLDAYGYDTALRQDSKRLFRKQWSVEEGAHADLFVMRCVLPHMGDPFAFLESLFDIYPLAKVLIEHQNLGWILKNNAWNQISHDHVSIFTSASFPSRFHVYSHGSFREGEWNWVLVSRTRIPGQGLEIGEHTNTKADAPPDFSSLSKSRSEAIRFVQDGDFEEVVVWGAAGKGAVLSFALARETDKSVLAIDVDTQKQGLFMEGSGVRVHSPSSLSTLGPEKKLVVVANQLHFKEVSQLLGANYVINSLGMLGDAASGRGWVAV